MSRVGKIPIKIPDSVTMDINGNTVVVKGPKGQQELIKSNLISVEVHSNFIKCIPKDNEVNTLALQGLTRSLISNLIIGVTEGFEIVLDIIGTGYRVSKKDKGLEFNLGFSHSIQVEPLDFNELDEENQNVVFIRGINKQQVGEQAAQIRRLRKPNPYTGNGIKYRGEEIKRKAGKTAVGGDI